MKKRFWRIFWILFVILGGGILIFLIFNSFKVKPQNENKDRPNYSYKEFQGNKKLGTKLEDNWSSAKDFCFPLL